MVTKEGGDIFRPMLIGTIFLILISVKTTREVCLPVLETHCI